jgi:hypothetical protein
MLDRDKELASFRYHLLSTVDESSIDLSTTINDSDAGYANEKSTNSPYCIELISERPVPRASSKWPWVIHALLLMLSFTFFSLSFVLRTSTLAHVQKFSAWCKELLVLEIRRHG